MISAGDTVAATSALAILGAAVIGLAGDSLSSIAATATGIVNDWAQNAEVVWMADEYISSFELAELDVAYVGNDLEVAWQ